MRLHVLLVSALGWAILTAMQWPLPGQRVYCHAVIDASFDDPHSSVGKKYVDTLELNLDSWAVSRGPVLCGWRVAVEGSYLHSRYTTRVRLARPGSSTTSKNAKRIGPMIFAAESAGVFGCRTAQQVAGYILAEYDFDPADTPADTLERALDQAVQEIQCRS